MEVLTRTGGIAQTNCFVIADELAKKAVLFDAPNDTTASILDEVQKRGWDLIGLWLTHGHFDHVADHAVVTARFPDAQLLMHPLEVPKLTGKYPMVFSLPFEIPPREPDGYLREGQVLHIGSIEVRVMHTPGHAAGHVVFYLPTEQVLVGGDETYEPRCDDHFVLPGRPLGGQDDAGAQRKIWPEGIGSGV